MSATDLVKYSFKPTFTDFNFGELWLARLRPQPVLMTCVWLTSQPDNKPAICASHLLRLRMSPDSTNMTVTYLLISQETFEQTWLFMSHSPLSSLEPAVTMKHVCDWSHRFKLASWTLKPLMFLLWFWAQKGLDLTPRYAACSYILSVSYLTVSPRHRRRIIASFFKFTQDKVRGTGWYTSSSLESNLPTIMLPCLHSSAGSTRLVYICVWKQMLCWSLFEKQIPLNCISSCPEITTNELNALNDI